MNLRVFVTGIAVTTALALAAYGFSPLLTGIAGLPDLFGSFWRLEALAIALSIALGFAWPYLRGLRKGDRAIATIAHSRNLPTGHAFVDYQMVPVVLLDGGRKGAKVSVSFADGSRGHAVVAEYAGILTPATVQVIEREIKGQ